MKTRVNRAEYMDFVQYRRSVIFRTLKYLNTRTRKRYTLSLRTRRMQRSSIIMKRSVVGTNEGLTYGVVIIAYLVRRKYATTIALKILRQWKGAACAIVYDELIRGAMKLSCR